MLDALLADGRVALLSAVILIVEIAFARRIAGPEIVLFVANAVSGLGLIGALFAALCELGAIALMVSLTVSLIAHLVYLTRIARRVI